MKHILFCLIFLIPSILEAQKEEVSDTLIVLFEHTGNNVLKPGKKIYSKPDLNYPMDSFRDYIVNKYTYCTDCTNPGYRNINFTFLSYPNNPNYKVVMEKRKNFLRRNNVVDQDWFNNTPVDKVLEILRNSRVLLVDPNFVYDDNYYLLSVTFYDNEE